MHFVVKSEGPFDTKAQDKILFLHICMTFLHSEYTLSVCTLSPAGVKVCCRPSPGRKPTRSGPMWRSSSAGSSPPSNRTAIEPADQRGRRESFPGDEERGVNGFTCEVPLGRLTHLVKVSGCRDHLDHHHTPSTPGCAFLNRLNRSFFQNND